MNDMLAQVAAAIEFHGGEGSVADTSRRRPLDPNKFGIAFAGADGEVHGAGDCDEPYSIQSISKVFTLALALNRGRPTLWDRIGREPPRSASTRSSDWSGSGEKPRNPPRHPG